MENKLLKEIEDFKYDVTHNGMYVDTYLFKRKDLIEKIEFSSEKCLNVFRYLFFKELITRDQYIKMKHKIENARKNYKTMLSFY